MGEPVVEQTEPPDRLRVRRAEVPRTRLVRQLRDSGDAPIVLVVGGGGFGKTTLVSQWLQDDPRSVAWLSIGREHDDPAVLLAEIVRLLDEFEPLEPHAKRRLTATSIDFSAILVPRLERTITERARPFVLVLDDVHLLRRSDALTVVRALASCVPDQSQLVLSGRFEPEIGVARLRADRRVHTIRAVDLAFDRDETQAFFGNTGLSLPADAIDQLWERTEGWAVGVYLAALALGDEDDPVAGAERFAGDDRLVVDYVREELLATLPRRIRDFLARACVLDELDAAACDHVLERDDSTRVLADAARACQLLIPLDRRNETYRMHQLLRDSLRSELAHRSPDLERELLARSAEWYEVRGDFDRAVEHAIAAGERERSEALIWRAAPLFAGGGRTATVERWLDRFTRDEITSRPALAAAKAWCALTVGDMPSLRYWAEIASEFPSDSRLPDGTPVPAAAALLRATVGAHGIEQMRRDAALAYELDRTGSPYRAIARYLEGAALRILGRAVEARDRLEEGESIGAQSLPAAQANCLAQLAALALEQGDWDRATTYTERFSSVVERFELQERPAQSVGFSIVALVRAHGGDAFDARTDAKHALFLASMLSTVAPWISVESRIMLARTFLLLGDVALARVLAREARELLALVPDPEPLLARLAQFEATIDADQIPLGVLATPMTPAEMRVLRYLPTHLTFAAIADELFVSRNTVKTQAISIYRKLGVSSRGPAVEAARGLGLLED